MWCVLSVYDRKACEFGNLFLARSNEVGARMFADTILGPQETILRQHPEDFVLIRVGEFDEVDGELRPCRPQVDVIDAEAVLRRVAVASTVGIGPSDGGV